MENERDALIALYFDLGMTYRDLLCTLAHRHNVILSERQLKRDLVRLNLRRRRYCNLADVVDFIRNELTGTGKSHSFR